MPPSAIAVLQVLVALATLGADAYKYTPHQRDHIHFYLFTEQNSRSIEGSEVFTSYNWTNLPRLDFDSSKPTTIIIHGFANNVKSEYTQVLKSAFFDQEPRNVIVVDWGELDPPPLYNLGTSNMEGVGARTAELIDLMVQTGLTTLDQLHVIGHSLGAHIAGIVSEHLRSGKLWRITGLDPAMPLIRLDKTVGRLSADDAELVEVVHTNAGLLGTPHVLGHIDFYPNGGKRQPGCFLDFTGSCSHGRSYELWAESIVDPTAFEAWRCRESREALTKKCARNNAMVIMGDPSSYSNGSGQVYYFETKGRSPFKKPY